MSVLNNIWDALVRGAKRIWKMCVKIVKEIVDFFADIFNWLRDYFNNLVDDNEREAIVVNWKELIDDAIRKGDVVDVGLKKNTIAAGVFNTRTNEIERFKVIEADSLDYKTKEVLGGRKIVIVE
jgi:hypothetical protein